jgi:DNA-directed RNA polymerase subunit RPC12/RpoP
MTIEFHCEHCGRKIDAPDDSSGKWGKCPKCHNKVRVPNPEEDEEFKLAPLDQDELTRLKQLKAETHKIEQDILSETAIPEVPPEELEGIPPAQYQVSEKELTADIIMYLRFMADGDLDEADKISNRIIPQGGKALKILEEMALQEIPEPELADVPQQVLSGLIKALRGKLR